MNKNILVSFLVIASVLFLATATVSAAGTNVPTVKINGDEISTSPAVIAGDTILVKVTFEADNGLLTWTSASDVKVKVTIEGNKNDVTAVTPLFDVKDGNSYSKILALKVPSDFEGSDLSQVLPLDVKIWNSDGDVDYESAGLELTVQKVSYDVAIKSVGIDNTVSAGQSVPVEVVLKNIGYNNVNDVYVTVSIPELNLQKSAYLGDLVTQNYKDSSSDDTDKVTVSGKLNLEVPYTAKAGVYTLLVEVKNDEATNTAKQEITIENSVSDIAIKSGNDLIVLNPTNQLKVYTVKYNSNEQTIVVPAGSKETVSIVTSTDTDVTVYSGETLLSTVKFSGSANQNTMTLTNPVFVLTVILAIVFLVLLVVLVVLITKKPQKAEEFGESYY